jgi:hypothetical protein
MQNRVVLFAISRHTKPLLIPGNQNITFRSRSATALM